MDEQHIHGIDGATVCAATCQREEHKLLLTVWVALPDSPFR
jgi:hypothetical protein